MMVASVPCSCSEIWLCCCLYPQPHVRLQIQGPSTHQWPLHQTHLLHFHLCEYPVPCKYPPEMVLMKLSIRVLVIGFLVWSNFWCFTVKQRTLEVKVQCMFQNVQDYCKNCFSVINSTRVNSHRWSWCYQWDCGWWEDQCLSFPNRTTQHLSHLIFSQGHARTITHKKKIPKSNLKTKHILKCRFTYCESDYFFTYSFSIRPVEDVVWCCYYTLGSKFITLFFGVWGVVDSHLHRFPGPSFVAPVHLLKLYFFLAIAYF